MKYIIMDLEWNQAVTKYKAVTKPVPLTGEIIQIGAVRLDEKFRIEDTFKIMVKPVYYTVMQKYVKKITNITDDELQNGVPFCKAYEHFDKWCGDEYEFMTWGPDDICILKANLAIHGIEVDLPKTYNLQKIFNRQITKENRQFSLSAAVNIVGEKEYSVHDALNDALNTYNVSKHLDLKSGIASYSTDTRKLSNSQSHNVLDMYCIENPKVKYRSKRKAMSSDNVVTFSCPKCGAVVGCFDIINQRKGKSDRKIAVAKCKNGDMFFVRFKFRRDAQSGSLTVKRLVYDLDEKNKKIYYDRISEENTK